MGATKARSAAAASAVPVPVSSVTINDGFWKQKLEVIRKITIDDVLTKFEREGRNALQNFDRVRDGQRGGHEGSPWWDGLIYETIRAASDLLATGYDAALDRRLDGIITRIAAAQATVGDGYLNTFTILMCPDRRWGLNGGNLRYQHDVYNAGCLVEAAVAHFRATGKRSLLDVAVRFAAHMCATIGPAPRKSVVSAHPLAEEAFVDLGRLFGESAQVRKMYPRARGKDFLQLVRFWMEERGHHERRENFPPDLGDYAQDHRPLLQQPAAVGHAVRATLMYTGIAAYARESGDASYLRAVRRIWDNAVTKKMHITGGVGVFRQEEMFGPEYLLPNDAYLETCAAVGMAFWAHQMGLALQDGSAADVFERALYNNVLAGLSLSGDRYFYQNPLAANGDHSRWHWHRCPCCPPMLLKLIARLGGCIYATDGKTLWLSHYVSSRVSTRVAGGDVTLEQATGYPWSGDVRITVTPARKAVFGLALRIPSWCGSWTVAVNGAPERRVRKSKGYVCIERRWEPGDRVELALAMPPNLVEAHPLVEADRGKVAIQRGPLVYCLESVDNGDNVDPLLPLRPQLRAESRQDLLGRVTVVSGAAADGRSFVAIPYFAWGNRGGDAAPGGGSVDGRALFDGPGAGRGTKMQVWLRHQGKWNEEVKVWDRLDDLAAWRGLLYRPLKTEA
jgi:DUF1680 family protein